MTNVLSSDTTLTELTELQKNFVQHIEGIPHLGAPVATELEFCFYRPERELNKKIIVDGQIEMVRQQARLKRFEDLTLPEAFQ